MSVSVSNHIYTEREGQYEEEVTASFEDSLDTSCCCYAIDIGTGGH